MKTITVELTDAEYEVIEKARQLHFYITDRGHSDPDLLNTVEVEPITDDEYVKWRLIEDSLSALVEEEENPEAWFQVGPAVEKEIYEKYGLNESYQKG